ncbi:hypothetical protein PIB30_109709, partial [Stylosanthes scabra]|nr:hypothetical protein [Stylosanthes scabra]
MQGSRRDKQIIEFDPEIERTLKKNQHRVRTQRSLQVDREEASSEDVVSEKYFEEEILEKIIEEKPSKLELKPLPPSLKYAFLDAAENFP